MYFGLIAIISSKATPSRTVTIPSCWKESSLNQIAIWHDHWFSGSESSCVRLRSSIYRFLAHHMIRCAITASRQAYPVLSKGGSRGSIRWVVVVLVRCRYPERISWLTNGRFSLVQINVPRVPSEEINLIPALGMQESWAIYTSLGIFWSSLTDDPPCCAYPIINTHERKTQFVLYHKAR